MRRRAPSFSCLSQHAGVFLFQRPLEGGVHPYAKHACWQLVLQGSLQNVLKAAIPCNTHPVWKIVQQLQRCHLYNYQFWQHQ